MRALFLSACRFRLTSYCSRAQAQLLTDVRLTRLAGLERRADFVVCSVDAKTGGRARVQPQPLRDSCRGCRPPVRCDEACATLLRCREESLLWR